MTVFVFPAGRMHQSVAGAGFNEPQARIGKEPFNQGRNRLRGSAVAEIVVHLETKLAAVFAEPNGQVESGCGSKDGGLTPLAQEG